MDPGEVAGKVLEGRSGILGAMFWMFGLSILLTLLLGWIPVVGPFIGAAIGGFVGGRRAGSAGRALLAAILPAVLLSLAIAALGAAAAAVSSIPLIGAVGFILAGAVGFILFINNLVLFIAALIGGATAKS